MVGHRWRHAGGDEILADALGPRDRRAAAALPKRNMRTHPVLWAIRSMRRHPDKTEPNRPAEGSICKIQGTRFIAELSSRGASLQHFYLTDAQYKGTEADDMSTTPDLERWRSSSHAVSWGRRGLSGQIRSLHLAARAGRRLRRLANSRTPTPTSKSKSSFPVTQKPFELCRRHDGDEFGERRRRRTSSRSKRSRIGKTSQIKGHLGRVSPFLTELSCARGKDVERKNKDDSDFKKHGWWSLPDTDRYAAVSNYYFAQAITPMLRHHSGNDA